MQEFRTLGEKIAYARKRAGFRSQKELSEAMNGKWSRSQIANYEADINSPGYEFLTEFERITGINLTSISESASPKEQAEKTYTLKLIEMFDETGANKNLLEALKTEVEKILAENEELKKINTRYKEQLLAVLEQVKAFNAKEE